MTTTPPTTSVRPIWDKVAVDPITTPLARRLSNASAITPNKVTALAGLLALGASAAFLLGELRIGGMLFLLRYACDNLDGQVARSQRRSSTRGAALDLIVDIGGISVVLASLTSYLVSAGLLPVQLALFLLATVVVYNWALAYRKSLAKTAGLSGDGGAGHRFSTDVPILRRWTLFCARVGMSPLPWAVEAEIFALGLGPLILPERLLPYTLIFVLTFYVVANIVNIRRIWRIAAAMDSETARVSSAT
jgi:phosphatidylglycerophosphate synthase